VSKNFEGYGSGLFEGTVPTLAWKYSEKSRTTSTRTTHYPINMLLPEYRNYSSLWYLAGGLPLLEWPTLRYLTPSVGQSMT
jgi:hypothetical protein